MRRTITVVPSVALALIVLVASSAAARDPMSLGASSQFSTDMAAVDDFANRVGVRPALWTLWSSWGDRGGRWRCFRGFGTCAFPGAAARGLRSRGITPSIYWQPTDPSNPGAGRFERYRNIVVGKHDRYIREWARAARNFGEPVVVRLAHEMNGTWFPWSLTNFDNTGSGFQAAWRHIVTEFRRVGARNVRFLWSPFQRCTTCSKYTYEQFYPGNRYVDYVGVTALNWGDVTWTSLDGLLAESLTELRQLTRTSRNPRGKPVILPEVGSNWVGGDKAAWIRDGYQIAYKRWPAIRAMVYFDYDTTFAGQPDWRLIQPSDGTAFEAYRSLASMRIFRAAFPLRPAPGPRRWKLMPLVPAPGSVDGIRVVAQDGTGEFATIGEAVATAIEGESVLIRAGTYDESVIVDKGITITGEGDRAGVVVAPSAGTAAFTFSGSGATLSNLTLRGTSAPVVIVGGAPTLEGLFFDAVGGVALDGVSAAAAIDVSGGSAAVIRANIVTGGAIGVRVADGTPILEANDVSGTTTAGIQVDGGAPVVTSNNVHDNLGSGVAILAGAATLSANAVSANTTGLLLGTGATPTLTGNTICGNATDVQVVGDGPLPDLAGNEVCAATGAEGTP